MADIFVLVDQSGNLLSPKRQASVLAKYCRSPESARTILEQVDEYKADSFQQKWIVDFGHNSIAEMASIPVCFEGVSIIASKIIERLQRPGVCEKSTRMQKFDASSMYWPSDMNYIDRDFLEYRVNSCFSLYEKLNNELYKYLEINNSSALSLKDNNLKRTVFDSIRGLLPAGIKTNLGINAYPRDLSWLISYLTGSNKSELVDIGLSLKNAVQDIGGPLIRHTEKNEWLSLFDVKKVDFCVKDIPDGPGVTEPGIVHLYDVSTETYSTVDYEKQGRFIEDVFTMYGMDWSRFDAVMNERPEKCEVPDIFKTIRVRFNIIMSYGSFRDLQRHRRCEQFSEPLGISYGYYIPNIIEISPFVDEYKECMDRFLEIDPFDIIDRFSFQYGVPIGFLHKFCFDMDLKELYYIAELRTQPQGHIEYRKIAYAMYLAVEHAFPMLMKWCRVNKISLDQIRTN